MNDEESQPGGVARLSKNPLELGVFERLKNRVLRLVGVNHNPPIDKEVDDFIQEHDSEGQISATERIMISNVLKLNQVSAGNIMVPRADIMAVSSEISMKELRKVITENEHTRIPIYEKSLDQVLGFIHSKDFLPLIGSKKVFKIQDVMRKILFVPPSMRALDLLVKMRDKRTHMAIVLDEHGGTDGLVTLEDVVEEIVGEIEDEHDDVDIPGIHRINDQTYHVNARTPIDVLEKELNVVLRDAGSEDYETLGGLVFVMAGHVPQKGESMEHRSGVYLEVIDADQRRVNAVLVKLTQAPPASDS